jgi:predicted NBD/HSP70 family sugar kinase
LIGVGVGTPGLVNTREGVIVNAVNLGWRDLPLAGLLKDRYKLPVAILNDSQAAALGEYTYAKAEKRTENMVIIIAGHGIGSGIIINGQLFHGDGGGAGEIGHVVVEPESTLLCRCGNHGCLETVASAQALIRKANERAIASHNSHTSAPEISFSRIVSAYEQGDPFVREMVLETGRYMGLGIASLIGTLNINKIVLTGDMICFGTPWLEVIRQTVSQHTLKEMSRDTQVILGGMRSNAVILGASAFLSNDYSLLSQRQSLRE